MKRIMTLSLLFAVALLASAADIPAAILKLHKANETMTCAFIETQTMPKMKKETKKTGTLIYTAPNELRLDYTDPVGDYTLMNATTVELNQGGKKQKFNIKDGKSAMAQLRATLLLSFAGDVKAVAEQNEATATYSETATEYICKLTSQNGKHGIEKLELVYNKKTGKLQKLVVTKKNGNYTTYSVKP